MNSHTKLAVPCLVPRPRSPSAAGSSSLLVPPHFRLSVSLVNHGSQIVAASKSPGRFVKLQMAGFPSAGLRFICSSKKVPGDDDTAGAKIIICGLLHPRPTASASP